MVDIPKSLPNIGLPNQGVSSIGRSITNTDRSSGLVDKNIDKATSTGDVDNSNPDSYTSNPGNSDLSKTKTLVSLPPDILAKIDKVKDLKPNIPDRTDVKFDTNSAYYIKGTDTDGLTISPSAGTDKYYVGNGKIELDEGVKLTQDPERVKITNPETGKVSDAISIKVSTGEEIFVPVGQKFSIQPKQMMGGTIFNIDEKGDVDVTRLRFSCSFSSRSIIV